MIQQLASHSNPRMLTFGVEGATNIGQGLYLVNNTFINEDSSRGIFVMVSSDVTTPTLLQNNLFRGTGTITGQASAIDRTNLRTLSPSLVNRAAYDLRPASGSPAINAGSAVGVSASDFSLKPTSQYKHAASSKARPANGSIDLSAYEATGTIITTPSNTTAPPTPAIPTTSTTTSWVKCANENGTCSLSGTRQVCYGVNDKFAYKSVTGSISCINATFGDPAYGLQKSCSYEETSTAGSTTTVLVATQTWTRCAIENGTCSFSGTHQVRYGANNAYSYRSATGAIACTNAMFGDLAYGTTKYCDYLVGPAKFTRRLEM